MYACYTRYKMDKTKFAREVGQLANKIINTALNNDKTKERRNNHSSIKAKSIRKNKVTSKKKTGIQYLPNYRINITYRCFCEAGLIVIITKYV